MNNDNSGAIVLLLAAIPCVLLFGSGAVQSGVGWVMGIRDILSVIFVVITGIARLGSSFKSEVSDARAKQEPWLYLFILWPGAIGNFAIFGIGGLIWMNSSDRFMDAVESIPYWWVPVTMILASLLVRILERAHDWLPQVPGTLANLVRAWLWFAVAPVASPVGKWREIQADRARGQAIGVLATSVFLVGALLAGVLLWPLGMLLPLGIRLSILEALRLAG